MRNTCRDCDVCGSRVPARSHTRTHPPLSNAVFDELKQSVRDIEFLADPTIGEVRFGCQDSIAAAVLPPIMERFSRQYPRVVLRMEVIGRSPVNAELPSLHERHIDFAIFRLSTPLTDQKVIDELHVEILFNDQLVVPCSEGVNDERLHEG